MRELLPRIDHLELYAAETSGKRGE